MWISTKAEEFKTKLSCNNYESRSVAYYLSCITFYLTMDIHSVVYAVVQCLTISNDLEQSLILISRDRVSLNFLIYHLTYLFTI